MKISFKIKKPAKKNDKNTLASVYVRLIDGKQIDLWSPSTLEVNPNDWDKDAYSIKSRILYDENERTRFNNTIQDLRKFVSDEYKMADKESIPKDWLNKTVDKFFNPTKYMPKIEPKATLVQLFAEFIEKHKISDVRKKNFKVIQRALQRYELFKRITLGDESFYLDIDNVTAETLTDVEKFLVNEYKYVEEYPSIYEAIPETRIPQARGQNTISDIFTKIRTFYLWCYKAKKTTNTPFASKLTAGYAIEECTYGTPYYITVDERNKLFETNLSHRPQLAIQRDIFVFQCLIGCRVGDLYKMTKANIIDGSLEYIPRKTKKGDPITVRIPLNDKAKEILERYKDCESTLLPFISEQKYNKAIKEAFTLAKLNRIVTTLNPLTREEEKKPLNEVASSHLARRCFVGNLYERVQDPNLISSMSGHKIGSKAFHRYKNVSDEMKKDLVKLLD